MRLRLRARFVMLGDMHTMTDIIARAGGVAKLAEACGVSRTSPYQWRVPPAEHLTAISRLTGIPPRELRPDLAAIFEMSCDTTTEDKR
jgi:DNA-binding transcriptional regulator YdaS (Cro superfamily)